MSFRIATVRALALIVLTASPALAEPFTATLTIPAPIASSLGRASSAFRSNGQPDAVTFSVPTKTGRKDVTLVPFELRANNYRSVDTSFGRDVEIDTPVELFRGEVAAGKENDFIRLSRITDPQTAESWFEGYLQADGVAYGLNRSAQQNTIEVRELTVEEAQAVANGCGVVEGDVSGLHELKEDWVHTNVVRVAELATEADAPYVAAEGSPQLANARILAIMNMVDGVFRSQVNVGFTVTFQHTHSGADPYSTTVPGGLLGQLANYWSSNHSGVRADLVHMWTGRDLDGSVVGIAYVGTVCGFSKYGLSQRFTQNNIATPLTAHEMGHNFDAVNSASGHDEDCGGSVAWLMCPSLNAGVTTMSPRTKTDINAFVGQISSCLTIEDDPPPPPPPSNNPPSLAPIPAQALNEYTTLNVQLSASDPDGDPVTFSVSPTRSDISISGSTLTFSPGNVVTDGRASVVITVAVTARDSKGAIDTKNASFTVANVNGSPVLQSPGNQTIAEGSLLDISIPVSDPDGDTVTITSTGLPAGALLESGLRFRFRPHGGQAGSYPITINARDPFGASSTVAFTVTVTNVPGVPGAPPSHTPGDFDRDGRCEPMVYRPVTGTWFGYNRSNGSVSTTQHGLPEDVPVPADYDGDNVTDYAVYRPSTGRWYVRSSALDTMIELALGDRGDAPCPADFDGDGRADPAVFRAATGFWFIRRSSDGALQALPTGFQRGDVCVPADYDGNGTADLAVYRPVDGTWHVLTTGETVVQWGLQFDLPLPADYDGDGRTDLAVYRASEGDWYIRYTGASLDSPRDTVVVQHGLGSHVPYTCDANGDGATDLAVFDPVSGNHYTRPVGSASDAPVQLGLGSDWVPASTALFRAGRAARTASFSALGAQSGRLAFINRSQGLLTLVGPAGNASQPLTLPSPAFAGEMDRDGDSFPDPASFVNGVWRITLSSTGAQEISAWGVAGDVPVFGADHDLDGRSDLVVYRPCDQPIGAQCYSAFYVLHSRFGTGIRVGFGLPGFTPVMFDFDGDGYDDFVVVDRGSYVWYVLNGRADGRQHGVLVVQHGLPGDTLVPYDYDRDGRIDLAVYRAGTWFVRASGDPFLRGYLWGSATDQPIPGTLVSPDHASLTVVRTSTSRRKTTYQILTLEPDTGAFSVLAPTLAARSVLLGTIPAPVVP